MSSSDSPTKAKQYDYLFKLVLIGGNPPVIIDSGVGKTNILSRFAHNTFSLQSKPTIGVQFATKTLRMDDKQVKMQVWDTAGQQRFRAITHAYYKGAVGALLVYDITRKSSYDNLDKWIKELRENADENITILLVGNKSDLGQSRTIKNEEASEYATRNKLLFMEISAMNEDSSVDHAFRMLTQEIITKAGTWNSKGRLEPKLLKEVAVIGEAKQAGKVHLSKNQPLQKVKENCC